MVYHYSGRYSTLINSKVLGQLSGLQLSGVLLSLIMVCGDSRVAIIPELSTITKYYIYLCVVPTDKLIDKRDIRDVIEVWNATAIRNGYDGRRYFPSLTHKVQSRVIIADTNNTKLSDETVFKTYSDFCIYLIEFFMESFHLLHGEIEHEYNKWQCTVNYI